MTKKIFRIFQFVSTIIVVAGVVLSLNALILQLFPEIFNQSVLKIDFTGFINFNDQHQWIWPFIFSLISVFIAIRTTIHMKRQIKQSIADRTFLYKPKLLFNSTSKRFTLKINPDSIVDYLDENDGPTLDIICIGKSPIYIQEKFQEFDSDEYTKWKKKNTAEDCTKFRLNGEEFVINPIKIAYYATINTKKHTINIPDEFICYFCEKLLIKQRGEKLNNKELYDFYEQNIVDFQFKLEYNYFSQDGEQYNEIFLIKFNIDWYEDIIINKTEKGDSEINITYNFEDISLEKKFSVLLREKITSKKTR